MKIAIVEDQAVEQQRLKGYIEQYCQDADIPVEIDLYNDGINIVDQYRSQYDVLYLDVEMAIMDGMTAARKIRERDSDVLIVFVTNHSQVAIQGYSVEAIDFILKPLSYFGFSEHFKKILKKLPETPQDYLYIKKGATTTKVPQQKIRYIENEGHRIFIHTEEDTYELTGTMKNMEQSLKGPFFRSNSCYIVNLAFVERVEGSTAYVDGTPLQVSRPRKKEFMQALTNYIGEDLL